MAKAKSRQAFVSNEQFIALSGLALPFTDTISQDAGNGYNHFQRNGNRRAIMINLVATCKQHEIRDIQLFCARGKVGFYEKFGFEKRPDDAPGMGIKYIPNDQTS